MKSIIRSLLATSLSLAGFFSSLSAQAAGEFVIAEKGEARCVIVATSDISPSEKTAVKELQKFLGKITGAVIEVKSPSEAASVTSNKIVVGAATAKEVCPAVKLDGLGKEGFVLKTIAPSTLVVAGGETRGTLYAAYALLHRLGVRWWAVNATDVPQKASVSLPALDERTIPILEYRDVLCPRKYVSEEENGLLFSVRNQMNGFSYNNVPEALGGRFWYQLNLVHSHQSLMEPVGDLDGRFATAPELWALRGGKNTASQVCPSQPKVFEIMKANILKQIDDNPQCEFVVVGQNDNKNPCQCDTCTALATAEEAASAPYLALANKLGEMLEKERPGRFIMAPAYEWSRKPPKTMKPHRNVGITLCSIECDFSRPLEEASTSANKIFVDDLLAWEKVAPKLYIWDYITNFAHYLMPHPNLDVLVPNVKFFVKHNVKGILEQGSNGGHGGEFLELRNWVLNRALWDPNQPDNGQALIKEFCEGFYGLAAPQILEYIALIHKPGRANPSIVLSCVASLDSLTLEPTMLAEAEVVMQAAEKAVASDPKFLARVHQAHVPLWYMLLKRGPQSKLWAAAKAKLPDLTLAAVAENLIATAKEVEINLYGEGEPIKGFLEWAKDYGSLCGKGNPLPPELEKADPANYRLIQACQMDKRARWFAPCEGASDGWACEIPTVAWTVYVQPSALEDLTTGKRYRLVVRVKSSEPSSEGEAFWAGILKGVGHGRTELHSVIPAKKVAASELADGKFHAITLGEFTAEPDSDFYNGRFWISLTKATSPKVFLDCLWFEEVK